MSTFEEAKAREDSAAAKVRKRHDQLRKAQAEHSAAVANRINVEKLPLPLGYAFSKTTVITFKKFFGKVSDDGYTYTATSPAGKSSWYVTGASAAQRNLAQTTWERLSEFMYSEESQSTKALVKVSVQYWEVGNQVYCG